MLAVMAFLQSENVQSKDFTTTITIRETSLPPISLTISSDLRYIFEETSLDGQQVQQNDIVAATVLDGGNGRRAIATIADRCGAAVFSSC